MGKGKKNPWSPATGIIGFPLPIDISGILSAHGESLVLGIIAGCLILAVIILFMLDKKRSFSS